MISGSATNFIESFLQYKTSNKLNSVNVCILGRNKSKDFFNTIDISAETGDDKSSYFKLTRNGGIYSLFKIYDENEFASKYQALQTKIITTYNFSPHLEKAVSKGIVKKNKQNQIALLRNFYSSVNDSIGNEIIFGTKTKYGFLIDNSTEMDRKFEIHESMNKMFVNVSSLTDTQQERVSLGNDFGFLVINTPGYYLSSLGMRDLDISIVRRGDIPEDTMVL